jgi:hypothetical protein
MLQTSKLSARAKTVVTRAKMRSGLRMRMTRERIRLPFE